MDQPRASGSPKKEDPMAVERLGIPEFFHWERTSSGWREVQEDHHRPILDLNDGAVRNKGIEFELNVSELVFRLIHALSFNHFSNQNRSCSQHQLFVILYPGEAFNPESSPMRVHAVLSRVRFWAAANSLPLVIDVRAKHFSISPETRMLFRVRNPVCAPVSHTAFPVELRRTELALRTAFPDQTPFKSSDVQRVLNVSLRTSVTRIKALSDIGRLRSSGSGRARQYWLESPFSLQSENAKTPLGFSPSGVFV